MIHLKPVQPKVYATYWPDRFGSIVRPGPEVSEVKWDDGSTVDRYVANEKLKEVPANQKSKAKPIAQENEMSANQVKEYNDLVAKAQALGLNVKPVKKFENSAIGDKRLTALRASMAEAPASVESTQSEVKQESEVSTKPKKARKSKSKANGNGSVRHGSKTEIVANLLKRKNGCTTAEILAATKWPAVSVPAMAKAAGLKLRKEKTKGEVTRYFGE